MFLVLPLILNKTESTDLLTCRLLHLGHFTDEVFNQLLVLTMYHYPTVGFIVQTLSGNKQV